MELEDRMRELENKVQQLRNIAFIISGLAIALGVTGAWALSAISTAKSEINGLRTDIGTIEQAKDKFENALTKISASKEGIFDNYANEKQKMFDKHANLMLSKLTDKTEEISAIKNSLDKLNKDAILYGGTVQLRNVSQARCMDLKSQDPSVLQLIACKDISIKNQTWILERR